MKMILTLLYFLEFSSILYLLPKIKLIMKFILHSERPDTIYIHIWRKLEKKLFWKCSDSRIIMTFLNELPSIHTHTHTHTHAHTYIYLAWLLLSALLIPKRKCLLFKQYCTYTYLYYMVALFCSIQEPCEMWVLLSLSYRLGVWGLQRLSNLYKL